MTTLDVLCDAYGLLWERGWTKETYIDADGCLCLSAALRLASGYNEADRIGNAWPAGKQANELEVLANTHLVRHRPRWVNDYHDYITYSDSGANLSCHELNDLELMTAKRIFAWLEVGIIAAAKKAA